MNQAQARRIVFRWAPLVIVLALLGAGVAYVVTRNQVPQYQATGRVLVLGQVEASALSLTPDEIIATDASLMTQPALIQRVINDLHLPYTEQQLSMEISVAQEGQTELIDVNATDPDAMRSAQIANAVISDFVATTQSQSESATQQAEAQVQKEVDAARAQVATDQAALTTAHQANSGVQAAQAQFDADNARLAQLNSELTQLQAQQQQSSSAIQVASPATVPPQPLAAHRLTSIGLGAFAGLLIGIMLALALQYLDQGLVTEEDVRAKLGLPTLAVVPSFRGGDDGSARDRRQAALAAEAYRRLRTSLLFSSVDERLRSVVVTSVRAGEGKTRTAANLAGVMAASGERTLLMDADMRRPQQHRMFGESLQHGVSELLLRVATAERTGVNGWRPTDFANLSLLSAGTIPPNPSEMLASKTTVGAIRWLEAAFDLVIIDTPPTQAVTDALSVAASASGTILVIEAGTTTAPQAQQAIDALRAVGATVIGVVLNKARRRSLTTYSYYYYYNTTAGADVDPDGSVSSGDEMLTSWKPLGTPQPAGHR